MEIKNDQAPARGLLALHDIHDRSQAGSGYYIYVAPPITTV